MRAYVAVTDGDWFRFLRARPDLDEVNFWQPSGGRVFRTIQPGDPFLFKLHYPANAIVGGGTFVWASTFPLSIAWEAFAEKNGAASQAEMRIRLERYRRHTQSHHEDYQVGCIILKEPFFFEEQDWMSAPSNGGPTSCKARPTISRAKLVASYGMRFS
jgi:putative restriction endonuclease